MDNNQIEIPQYYICPISFQIMEDPVTTITGITYDRESIEQWLKQAEVRTCPVTRQHLPRHSELTPNHMLRRLIQAWCTTKKSNGADRISTSRSPLSSNDVRKLIADLFNSTSPFLFITNLKKIEDVVGENEKIKKCMMDSNLAAHMLSLIIRCSKEGKTLGLEEALRILNITWQTTDEIRVLVNGNWDVFDSLTWFLPRHDLENIVILKPLAILALRKVTEIANRNQLERLQLDFFKTVVQVTRERISEQTTKACLEILIDTCPWGRSRNRIVEAGAVLELIEMELGKTNSKKTTELLFCLLAQMCYCNEGRDRILQHACSVALLAKRLLSVSNATDNQIVLIIALICKFSGTNTVVREMLNVGAVSKLCVVLQSDCEKYLKDRAREVLRMHSKVWNDSPCIGVYTLPR